MARPTTPTDPAGVVSSLLDAIFADPDDDQPRRVYADALSEAGDPRGELIAVQCDLASIAKSDPRRPALVKREAALLKGHKAAWSLGIRGLVFERGFVDAVRLPLEDASRYRALFEREPIRKLTLTGGERASVDRLADFRLDALDDLRSELARKSAGEGLATLLRRPELSKLRLVALQPPAVDDEIAAAIAESPALENLRSLLIVQGRPAISREIVARLRARFGDRVTV